MYIYYICVCIYIYTCIYVQICVYICIHVCMYIHIYIYIHTYVCMYTYSQIHVFMHTDSNAVCTHTQVDTYTCTYTYGHIRNEHMYVYTSSINFMVLEGSRRRAKPARARESGFFFPQNSWEGNVVVHASDDNCKHLERSQHCNKHCLRRDHFQRPRWHDEVNAICGSHKVGPQIEIYIYIYVYIYIYICG